MTVTLVGDQIRISGAGRIEDAENLVALLQGNNRRVVDLAEAEVLHTAVVQVLLAFRPGLAGLPDDPFFRTWLMPGLTGTLTEPGIVTTAADVAEAASIDADGSGPPPPTEQT
jgi:hypothetical protein